MSFSSETLTSGASFTQRGYDDSWGSEFNAGRSSTYCAGSGHATVFKIVIPTASLTNKYYLTLSFNGAVRTAGQRTLNYGISTTFSTNYNPSNLPSFLPGTTGIVTYSGLNSQNRQLILNIGSSSVPFTSTSTTLYVWLYNTDSTHSMECYRHTSYYSAVVYRQSVGAPSAPTSVTITSTSSTAALSYIKPTQTVRVRWSGAAAGTGGSITGYKIWYRQDNTTTANFKEVASSSTSGYTDISISGYTPGNKLIVSVGTKGTGDLYSDNKRASTSPIVNNPPTITTASFNQSAIISGNSTTINLVGSSGDSGQSVSYKYSETSSGTKYSTSNGASFNFTHTGNDSGTYGKYFYAYDGLEYSTYKYASITVHSVLTASLNSSQYKTSTSLGGIKYLKKGTFKINTNKTNLTSSNIIATVGGKSASIKNFSRNSTLITFVIDFTELTEVDDLYKSGNKINITFTIDAGTYNGVTNSKTIETSFTTGNSGEGIVFSSDNISTLSNFSLSGNYATGDINSELFNEKIKLEASEFDSKINSIKNLASSIVVTSFISSDEGSTYTKNKDLDYTSTEDNVSSLLGSTKIKYKVVITDPNGAIYSSETPNVLTKVIRPYIKEDEVSYIENSSPNIVYYPTSGKIYDSTISETIFIPTSATTIMVQIPATNIYINGVMLSSTSTGSEISSWKVKFNDEINLDIAEVDTSNNGYIILKIDITKIISAANSSSLNKNSYHDASLSISFTDKYGLKSDFYIKQSILKIDFREKPIIESFKIYHSTKRYYDGDYSEVISNNNTQKVNPDEYIKFSITVTDDNVEKGEESYDNFVYIIKRKDLSIEAGTYVEITRGNLTTFYNSDDNSYGFIEYTIKSASIYYEIKKYKYAVEVIDTSNLSTSKETDLSTLYDLICFPTNSSPDSNITITFDKEGKFIISLGNNLCGYDNYSNHKNLERGEYTKDFKIAVFSSIDYNTILNLSKESWNNNDIFTESVLTNGYDETKTITRAPSKNLTTYYRVGLKLSTGLNVVVDEEGNITTPINYIYTWSKIYSIDPNNPVVSIRKSYLGINTGSTIDDDNSEILLQVNALSSGSRKKIILYSPAADETSPGATIEINLANGLISGAIIDCGKDAWNNLTSE